MSFRNDKKFRRVNLKLGPNRNQQGGRGWMEKFISQQQSEKNNEIIILPSLGTTVNASCLLNSILYFKQLNIE